MKKFVFLILVAFSISSCANFKVNGTICDNIGTGSEPTMQNGIPTECKRYDKEKAYKAYDKVDKKEKPDVKDIVEFDKEKEKK